MNRDNSRSERRSFTLSGTTPVSTRFMRDRPAADEGPEQTWELARQLVDHAAWFLDELSTLEKGREIRGVVLSALLRRAVISAEGVRVCLYHGLEEPAIVLLRNLLEAELNLRLVTADETDRMAKRLAANHYLRAKKHITSALKHPEVVRFGADPAVVRSRLGHRDRRFGRVSAGKEYGVRWVFSARILGAVEARFSHTRAFEDDATPGTPPNRSGVVRFQSR